MYVQEKVDAKRTSPYTLPSALNHVARLDQGIACIFSTCLLRCINKAFHRVPDDVLDESRHCIDLVVYRMLGRSIGMFDVSTQLRGLTVGILLLSW